MKLSFKSLDTIADVGWIDLFRPTIRINPPEFRATGPTMMARAGSIVPVIRETPVYGARGTFKFHPDDPSLDYIAIPPDVNQVEETIVLAHEIGHAENSRLERDRWAKMIPELVRWRHYSRRPNDIEIILEEEKRANERGRFHIRDLSPHLLSRYDDEMARALDYTKRHLNDLI